MKTGRRYRPRCFRTRLIFDPRVLLVSRQTWSKTFNSTLSSRLVIDIARNSSARRAKHARSVPLLPRYFETTDSRSDLRNRLLFSENVETSVISSRAIRRGRFFSANFRRSLLEQNSVSRASIETRMMTSIDVCFCACVSFQKIRKLAKKN